MTIIQILAFLFLGLLPGIALATSFGSSRTEVLLALPLSCGVVYTVGNYSSLLGIPVNSWWLLVVATISLFILATRRPWKSWNFRDLDKGTAAGIALGLATGLIFVLMWSNAAGHLGQLLPNHDAMYHSYVIRNIVETDSTKVADALRLFPLGTGSAANFYPVGLHSLIAVLTQTSGVSINGGMNLVTLGLGLGLFPLAMWVWTKEFFNNSVHAAFLTPIAVFLVSSVFPFSPMSWGGMPAIVGMCVAPLIAVSVFRVLQSPSNQGVFLITIALVGIFSIHSTELVLVGLLTIALIAKCGGVSFSNVLRCGMKVSIGAGFALAPVLIATAGGASERSLDYQPVLDVATTLGQSLLFSFPGFVLLSAAILLVLGIIASNREKESVLTWGFVIVLGFTCMAARFPESTFVRLFTKPWYGQVLRLNYNIIYFAVPLIVWGISALFSSRKNLAPRIVSIAVAVLLIFTGIAQVHRADRLLLQSWYKGLIPTNKNSITAYEWMASRLEEDEYVITDYDGIDGSTWMYALSGAKPTMYGAIADDSRDITRTQKIAVLTNIGKLNSHPELVRFLRSSGIKYLYFDERTNVISPKHSFSLEDLRNDTVLSEVFQIGNAHVFEINS
jgi:hypothetical protein